MIRLRLQAEGDPAKSRNSLSRGVEKSQKYCEKIIFVKKYVFFIVRKVMLILRFPHSFGVWGCWGRSKTIDFAIFQSEIEDFRWTRIEPKSLISPRFLSMEILNFRLENSKIDNVGALPALLNSKTMRETKY